MATGQMPGAYEHNGYYNEYEGSTAYTIAIVLVVCAVAFGIYCK